ncbi:MAG: hypothetical protein ACKOA1_06675 [Bacteroidota bacterium]
MHFFRTIITFFFLLFIAPGPLLHELSGHEDTCDYHAVPTGTDEICPEHHHCEICHFEGPGFFETTFSKDLVVELNAEPFLAGYEPAQFSCLPEALSNRGPPTTQV